MKQIVQLLFLIISLASGQNNGWLYNCIANGVGGLESTITKSPSKQILLAGGIGAAIASQYDDNVQNWFLENPPLPKSINKFGDLYGNLYSGIILLGVTGIHSLKQSQYQVFEYAFATLGANGLTTVLLKEAVGRERPNGSNHRSFPSGHTSHSFTVATIFKELYGWKLGVPAYCLATITAMNRLEDNKHYLSDVVFGASLGTAFGMGFSNVYLKKSNKLNIGFNPVRSELQFSFKLN